MNKRAPYNDFKWKSNEKFSKKNQLGDLMFNLKVIPNKSKHWKFYAKGMNAYVADHQELLKPDEAVNIKQNKNIDAYGSYLSYMSRDSAKKNDDINPTDHIWHYSNLKHYKKRDISTNSISEKCKWDLVSLDDVRKIHKDSHIWSIVISERDLDMKDIMFKNQHKIVDRIIRSMFDFPVDATCAFHGNTEHPHIHIMVYQPDITKKENIRQKWKIRNDKLASAKKSYFYFLINNKNYFKNLLLEKSKLRQLYNGELLQRVVQKEFIDLLNVLGKDKEPWLDSNGKQKLGKNDNPLYQMKFQYNRLNKDSKKAVNELKDFILNLESDNQDIKDLQEQYKRFRGIGSQLIEKEFDKLPNKKKESLIEKTNDLFKEADEKLCQQLLKTAKQFYLENYKIFNQFNSDFNPWIENRKKLEDDELTIKKKEHFVLPPAIHKLLTANSVNTIHEMYKNVNYEVDLNKNLTALKKLMREIEQEKQTLNN